MPLYEYQCHVCGLKVEKLVPYIGEHTVSCTRCGGTTRKLMSSFVYPNYPVKSVKLNGEEIR